MNSFFAKLTGVGATWRAVLPLFAGAVLAACGGGGEDTSNPPGEPGDGLRLVVSSAAVATEGSSTGAASSRTITFSVQNYSAGDPVHIGASFTTSAIQTVEHVMNGAAGTLTIHFKPASVLTPGVYTDTVNLLACRESPCVNHLPGSPRAITVSHTVPTQTAPPTPPPSTPQPTLVLSQTTVQATAVTYMAAPVRTVGITINNQGAQNVYVGGSYSTNGILAPSLVLTGLGTLTLTIFFQDPSTLGPGTYTDTVTLRACTESPCVNHIVGSPQVISITYVVTTNPNPPAVTFSTNAVSRAAVNDAGNNTTLVVDPISFVVANAPIETPTTRLTFSGPAVAGAVVGMPSPQQGSVNLWLKEPAALGAGTYHSVVQVQVCLDTNCARQLAGSPHTIDVTYVVTGSSHPATRVSWMGGGMISGANMNTSETRTPWITLMTRTTNMPAGGLYIRHTESESGLITSVGSNPSSRIFHISAVDEYFQAMLRPPATLGSGIFTDSMIFEACFDAACTEIVPNSRFTLTPEMLVTATEGVEFTRQNYQLGSDADAMVWSPADRSLYLATSGGLPGTPGILRLDPVAMAVTATATLGYGDLHKLAVTDDASFLYATSNFTETVQRLRLPGLVPDLAVQLGRSSDNRPYAAGDIDTLPGQPQSFVATLNSAGNHSALRVYDDAVPRPVTVEPVAPRVEQERWLVPAATPGTFISRNYGGSPQDNSLERLVVDAAGIRVESSSPMPVDRHVIGHPHRVGTRLFHRGTSVLDADTGALVDTFVLPDAITPWQVLPDERNRRLFVATYIRGRACLLSYDLDTLELLAIAPLETSFTSSMVLWGEEGLAFTNGSLVTVVSGTFFSSYRGEPTQ